MVATIGAATTSAASAKRVEERSTVVIRFAGDSGDGMQLTGTQFTNESALAGNDIATLPDFPAEIRAPIGTLAGVSGYQLNFSSGRVFTPGDDPDVLVAMNPAALRVNLADLVDNGILIVDTDAFTKANVRKAGYDSDPLEDPSLERVSVFKIALTKLTSQALKELGLPNKTVVRCRNFFALGLCSWLFTRPTEETLNWIAEKFKKAPQLVEANTLVFKAGWNYGETTEAFHSSYTVAPATGIEPGTYTNMIGNKALAYGLMAGAAKADKRLFLGTYPITPATDILHELASHKELGVITFQAEDEIAGVCSALGASFGGAIGVTTSSGPGIALKSEAIGLGVMVELPLVVVNVQRGGPSTGLPTKTEQADLLQALFGRNGESPVAVVAPCTPTDCFMAGYEAVATAIRYMTPVIVLSDGYLANGAEPWSIPKFAELPSIEAKFWTQSQGFHPYLRNEDTLARPWVVPGTPGFEHRIGGIEKDYASGNISYDADNHERMSRVRASKIERIAEDIPPARVEGSDTGEVLVIGWGSTYGAITEAVAQLNAEGIATGHLHFRWLNPFPRGVGSILKRFKHVVVPEMNLGQLIRLIRDRFLVDARPITKIQGQPFKVRELVEPIRALVEASK